MERTFVMIKPDGVQRRHVGDILARFERKGLKLAALKLIRMSQEKAENLYSIHKGRPFYETLVRFVTSSPAVVMVLEGNSAIPVARKLLGATFGTEAEAGTIRGDFGISKGFNLIHGSDSAESAKREIPIFFGDGEIQSYDFADAVWVNEEPER